MADADKKKVTVLLSEHEFERLSEYCRDRGHKKSTLIARLIREHLDAPYSAGGGQPPARAPRRGRRTR